MSDKDYTGSTGATGGKGSDNYKPLAFYEKHTQGGDEQGFSTFEDKDEYYFCYKVDGDVVLISEGYSSVKGRNNGVASVEKNMVNSKRYKTGSLSEDRHYFGLVAGNHQEIATSTWLESESAMLAMIDRLVTGAWSASGSGALAAAGAAASGVASAASSAVSSSASATSTVSSASAAPVMAASSAKPTADYFEPESKGSNWWWWLLLIPLLLLLWWAFTFCDRHQCGEGVDLDVAVPAVSVPEVTVPKVAVPEVTVPKITAPEMPKIDVPDVSLPKVEAPEIKLPEVKAPDLSLSGLGKFFGAMLPNGIKLDIPEFGVESKLINFIKDDSKLVDKTTWFNFDRINFATGSSNLSEASQEQIDNITKILSAYPDVDLKIGGYTDNTGSLAFNNKLSQNRADAVKAKLVLGGVDAERLESEGYGPLHPVATNDTPEGRAQNRRIALRVTKK